jgi:two-component system, LytTR family, sensor kinase
MEDYGHPLADAATDAEMNRGQTMLSKLWANLNKLLSSFWVLQFAGWGLYGVMIYITFLTVVPPSSRFNLLQVKVSRTIAGFLLSCVLRLVYKRIAGNRSVPFIASLIVIGSFLFGCLWPFGERIGLWLMNRQEFGFSFNLARYPIEVLDYSTTLIGWSALYFGIKYWQRWQTERDRTLQAETLAHQAQLDMLRYQLNPHFLFNALNSIRASIDEDSRRAKSMVTEFSEFLRYSLLDKNSGNVALKDEMEAIKNYLAIEKIRFEDRLDVAFNVDRAAEEFQLPAFLIHPLVENAVKHGMANSASPLKIRITARVHDDELHVEVANTGQFRTGIGSDKVTRSLNSELISEQHSISLDALPKSTGNGTGIGLRNVSERLAKLYPNKNRFTMREDDGWVRTVIEIRK